MNKKNITISAVIIVKNAEKTLAKCIKNLSWCDEIIVVDDYSSDNTSNIAKKLATRVYKRRLNNDFASQRNFGLNRAKSDWIIFIDGDEYVTTELKSEITKKIGDSSNKYRGFSFRRMDIFMNHELKYGPAAKHYFIRGVKKKSGYWVGKQPETLRVKGEILKLNNKIIHKRQENLSGYITKINFYSDLQSKSMFENGEKSTIWLTTITPVKKFINTYICMFGFLDGMYGFILCFMLFLIELLIYLKLLELQKSKD